MSSLPSSRPTLPPIRDVFPDEFPSKADPPLNLPSSTQARLLRVDDDRKTSPFLAQYPVVHSIYEPSFRYSDIGFHGTPNNVLFHNHGLSDEHLVLPVQPDTSNLFFANPRHSQSIYTSSDTEFVESFESTSSARYNSDASSPSTHPSSFTHGVQHEKRNNSASYKCLYCEKMFSRPSSLKIHLNSHTGEKPFACPVRDCGRSFSVLSNMRRHARAHSTYAELSLSESASDHYLIDLHPT